MIFPAGIFGFRQNKDHPKKAMRAIEKTAIKIIRIFFISNMGSHPSGCFRGHTGGLLGIGIVQRHRFDLAVVDNFS